MDFPLAGIVRSVRRRADLSQRELANRARVSQTTVARIEAGTGVPSLGVLEQLLAVASYALCVVDGDGRAVLPMLDSHDTRDGGGRRYPSHLDTLLDPRFGEWWGDRYGLARPPETFRRCRARRDSLRARSRWDVRVSELRHVPEPRLVPACEQSCPDGRYRCDP